MKKKHNRPQKRLITQLSLWLALLLAFTGCAESTVTSQDNTYAIEQLATIPSELLEASETAVSEPESGQPQETLRIHKNRSRSHLQQTFRQERAHQHFPSGRFRHTPAHLIQRSMATSLISQRRS